MHASRSRQGKWLGPLCSLGEASVSEGVREGGREGGNQRYKKRRREMGWREGGGAKYKEPSSEKGRETEYETGRILKNKREERRWIAAPLQTGTWWMGLLPKKPEHRGQQGKCVCSSHSVCACVYSRACVCVRTEAIHLGLCCSDHTGAEVDTQYPFPSHKPKLAHQRQKTALGVSCQT